MTTTPRLWKSRTQVNTTDAAVSAFGGDAQLDGVITALPDGGSVVFWTDNSGAHNPNGTAVVGQRYDILGNKIGGEVDVGPSLPINQGSPASV